MDQPSDIEKRTATIKRSFSAPRALVWDAWTKPEHIANWWGPAGMTTHIKKHDFRVGGDWEFVMPMPNGKEFISFGTYSRIEAPELLETTANFIPMTEGVTLVAQFIDKGESTDFIFKVIHPTVEYCKQQEDMGIYNGWGSVFKGLESYLSGLSS